MNARRTDLALEAHALFRAAQKDDAIDGLALTERTRRGCAVMKGLAFVGEKVVCECEFMAQIIKNK